MTTFIIIGKWYGLLGRFITCMRKSNIARKGMATSNTSRKINGNPQYYKKKVWQPSLVSGKGIGISSFHLQNIIKQFLIQNNSATVPYIDS